MKIVVVHNSYQQKGGEDVVFQQECAMLERAGHQVVTYCRSNWEIDGQKGLARILSAPKVIWSSQAHHDFLRLLERERPDIVHVHNTFYMMSPSIFHACSEAGVPVVQSLHNYRLFCPGATFFRDGRICEECSQHGLMRSIQHACYRKSRAQSATVAAMLAYHRYKGTFEDKINCFIALTHFAKRKYVENGLAAEKVMVKPNFVYPDPGAGSGDGNYGLFVGRLSAEKRVSTMLDAWSRLKQPVPLKILGDGPEAADLRAQAARLGLRNVSFEGLVPREQTLNAIRNANFLVFSSEWYENFPVTIGEAFACGTPVICSRLGAMQEIVDDGRTGLHFTLGDAADLADKVQYAWGNRERTRQMAKEARREYESKYTAEKNYPQLMAIYQHTIRFHSGTDLEINELETTRV